MFGRLKQMIIKEFIQTLRDKRTRFILIGPPVIQMMIFNGNHDEIGRHCPVFRLEHMDMIPLVIDDHTLPAEPLRTLAPGHERHTAGIHVIKHSPIGCAQRPGPDDGDGFDGWLHKFLRRVRRLCEGGVPSPR